MKDKDQAFSSEPQLPARVTETSAQAIAEQKKALVYAHYELALRKPRDVDQARQGLLRECDRPSFAKVARYNKPIGKGVTGPSIRFAEAAIRHYRNILITTTTVFDDTERRIVNVKCADVELNLAYDQDITINKTVERKTLKAGESPLSTRVNSKGELNYILPATDDDILNKQNALISKAIRTLGLRLIPGDIIDECMEAVIETQKNADAADPDAAKKKIFDSFAEIGIQAKEIKVYLGHAGETLTTKELSDLRGIYQAIKDGELTWREAMDKEEPKDPPKDPNKGNEGLKEKLGTNKSKTDAPPQPKDDETLIDISKQTIISDSVYAAKITKEQWMAWLQDKCHCASSAGIRMKYYDEVLRVIKDDPAQIIDYKKPHQLGE
jgi:hypothetical protein